MSPFLLFVLSLSLSWGWVLVALFCFVVVWFFILHLVFCQSSRVSRRERNKCSQFFSFKQESGENTITIIMVAFLILFSGADLGLQSWLSSALCLERKTESGLSDLES